MIDPGPSPYDHYQPPRPQQALWPVFLVFTSTVMLMLSIVFLVYGASIEACYVRLEGL